MSNFKPQIRVITVETQREYRNSFNAKSPYVTIVYNTYRELKKNLKRHLEENLEAEVSVSRSRRGEWGEWFENWQLINGKPQIVKKGWM
jgi:hypothetical protein